MARELVLVPKIKYERLLKLNDKSEQSEQLGGQVETRDGSPMVSDGKETREIVNSDEKLESAEKQKSTESAEKPYLYVDKPLSKMHFGKKIISSSRNRSKKVFKTYPNNKKNDKGKPARASKKVKSAKLPWTNYIV